MGRVWVVCCVWCRRWLRGCGVEPVWREDDVAAVVCFGVDQYAAEEDLVEQLLEVVGGGDVHAVAVFEQVQGLLEVLADLGGVGLVAIELALDGVEFSADAVLLLLEQLQGDGSGVVGLEQAAALVLQLGASDSQGMVSDPHQSMWISECS